MLAARFSKTIGALFLGGFLLMGQQAVRAAATPHDQKNSDNKKQHFLGKYQQAQEKALSEYNEENFIKMIEKQNRKAHQTEYAVIAHFWAQTFLLVLNTFFIVARNKGVTLPHFWKAPWWDILASITSMSLMAGCSYATMPGKSKLSRFVNIPSMFTLFGMAQAAFEMLSGGASHPNPPRLNLALSAGAALFLGQTLHAFAS